MRHELINFLNANLRDAESVLAEVSLAKDSVSFQDSREFLEKLEDPANDQLFLLAFCSLALGFNYSFVCFDDK